jgi:hypothetical protein
MDIFRIRYRVPFPNLNESNHRTTSPPTPLYNCFGWAIAGEEALLGPERGYIWPSAAPRNHKLSSFEIVVAEYGYDRCETSSLEPGWEKIALFGIPEHIDHAARQLSSGRWTSKLGREEDIEHDTPEAVAGGAYGTILAFFKRATEESQ